VSISAIILKGEKSMDPITMAIGAALLAGAVEGVTDVAKTGIVEAYKGLKALIQSKFGQDSDVVKAVERLEDAPDSASRANTLQQQVAASKADQDAEIVKAAQDLLDKVNAHPGGASYIQTIQGSYNAQAQDHSTATVNIGQPNTPPNKPTS
jgi:uncharacterized iron-regulated protein